MKASFLLIWAVALFLPIIAFVWLGDNANERMPVLVFAVCIILFAIAGWITGGASRLQWTAWAVVVGIVEACALVFMV